MKPNDLLFVYGTLRAGGRWHHLLDGCEHVGYSQLPGTLYDVGVPVLNINGKGQVLGEVYRMDTYARIDRLKKLEFGYVCSQVNGMWVFHKPGFEVRNVVKDGDWIKHVA